MSFLSGLGTVGGAILGSAIPGVGTALGATIGGGLGTAAGGLFGGGGSGSSGGGGGGGSMAGALPAPLPFMEDYLESKFGLDKSFSDKRLDKYIGAMDRGKGFDKYGLQNFMDIYGVDPDSKEYFDVVTSTIGRPRGEELAGVIGQTMFRGGTPSRQQIQDAYKYAKVTGSLGSPSDASRAFSSFFAQTPEGMKNRMPSSQELLAGMKYGPLVGTESGVFQFAGSPRTREMIDRLDKTRSFTSQRAQDIFNT